MIRLILKPLLDIFLFEFYIYDKLLLKVDCENLLGYRLCLNDDLLFFLAYSKLRIILPNHLFSNRCIGFCILFRGYLLVKVLLFTYNTLLHNLSLISQIVQLKEIAPNLQLGCSLLITFFIKIKIKTNK